MTDKYLEFMVRQEKEKKQQQNIAALIFLPFVIAAVVWVLIVFNLA